MMTWTYHRADRTPVFQHYRRARRPTPDDLREKRYGYRFPIDPTLRVSGDDGWVWRKPAEADGLLYRLPIVLTHPDRTLVLTEGERDCLELVGRRILASCHHGGAGKFTPAMAESIAGHRSDIVIVRDQDPPGAKCAELRYDLLRSVGIPASRLVLLSPRPTFQGADVRDHFAAGHGLGDFKHISIDELRPEADQADASSFEDSGYWIEPLTVEELSELRDYLHRRAQRKHLRLIKEGVA